MKLHKKLIIVAAAVIVVGGAGTGVALAMQPNEQPKQEQKQASIEQPKAVEPKAEAVEEVVEQRPSAVASAPTQQQTVSEQPKFGEDPNTPGAYIVFDKTWVMQQAGIAENDYSHVTKILRGWIYKGESKLANLCQAYPAEKMKSFGDDYLENPVTQLRWCNDYVLKRYGSWDSASQFFDTNRTI